MIGFLIPPSRFIIADIFKGWYKPAFSIYHRDIFKNPCNSSVFHRNWAIIGNTKTEAWFLAGFQILRELKGRGLLDYFFSFSLESMMKRSSTFTPSSLAIIKQEKAGMWVNSFSQLDMVALETFSNSASLFCEIDFLFRIFPRRNVFFLYAIKTPCSKAGSEYEMINLWLVVENIKTSYGGNRIREHLVCSAIGNGNWIGKRPTANQQWRFALPQNCIISHPRNTWFAKARILSSFTSALLRQKRRNYLKIKYAVNFDDYVFL